MTQPILLAATGELDILNLILHASGVVTGVLLLLAFFSVACWYIIGYKIFYLKRARAQTATFLDHFWNARRLDEVYQEADALPRSPVAQLFKAGYDELGRLKRAQADGGGWLGGMQSIERALKRAHTAETTGMESMLPFLATTGSAAPFIGLFGTVWGIMNSFRSIGAKGAANLATVAPGIAEALVATAIGLVAAIPAVMAYNYFVRQVKVLTAQMDTFGNDYLNIIKRHFFK